MSAREREYNYLRAELAELDNLLSMTPKSAVIDRMSLEYRKSQVEAELEANPPLPRWPASAHLTFNGKPVVDRQGIYADFGAHSVDTFSEIVISLAASQQAALGERGVIPNREDYRLLITGTSHGSFGFEIEEVLEQATLLPSESPVEQAIEQAKDILESLTGDEETLAEAIAYTDDRALQNVRRFLRIMVDNQAVCSLSVKDKVFRFTDVGQVSRGLSNLGEDNIREENIEMVGYFQGFLPKVRRAEFVDSAMDEVISARVDHNMENAEAINAILGQTVNVSARFRQVGNSRPRYTIVGYDHDADSITRVGSRPLEGPQ